MSLKLSTGARNAMVGTIGLAGAFTGGVVRIYAGPQVANPNSPPTGLLLGVATEGGGVWTPGDPANGIQFKAPEDGVLQKTDDLWQFTGLAKGTAGWWRMVGMVLDDDTQSLVLCRMDGSISAAGSAEMKLSSTAIDVGVPVTIDRAIFRLPG